MENCGFPVIPRYLEKETFHAENFMEQMFTVFILNHLHQVKNSGGRKIPHISNSLAELDLCTDAILLARDDAKSHKSLLKFF